MAANQKTTLYFREGSSDKVYSAQLEAKGDGWIVSFQFGRRGATLTPGTKTQSPVSFDEGLKIYNKLVAEKTKKGYTPGEDGTPYTATPQADRATGIYPQLLVPASEALRDKLLDDDRFGMQPKMDGKHIITRKNGKTIGINRDGLEVGIPETVVNAFAKMGSCQIDGEMIGDDFHVFDMLELDGFDMRSRSYITRYRELMSFVELVNSPNIKLVKLTISGKWDEYRRLKAAGAEGVVFKRLDAPYKVGRPPVKLASAEIQADQFKFKFIKMASVIVTKKNAKRSVNIAVTDDATGNQIDLGNVTIPANHDVPNVGAIIEVKYLYAYRGGSLAQPVYLGLRDDIHLDACVLSQLQYKDEAADVEGEGE